MKRVPVSRRRTATTVAAVSALLAVGFIAVPGVGVASGRRLQVPGLVRGQVEPHTGAHLHRPSDKGAHSDIDCWPWRQP